jgi:prevent-host-death family protein
MRKVGILEAKTRLSELVVSASNGETVTITRHGKPVAKLVQYKVTDDAAEKARRRRAVEAILSLPRAKLRGLTIRQLIDEGRRF